MFPSINERPEPPHTRVINSNCGVFCNICHSTKTRINFWNPFSERTCDNPDCKSHNLERNNIPSHRYPPPPPPPKIIKNNEKPFTKDEEKIMNLITQSHKEFLRLERVHPMEVQEWVFAIHQLQSILSHRVLVRDYPKYFKSE